jgi:2-C-methyl-D-erythritol 2,4-cyclodiphosphate synthase
VRSRVGIGFDIHRLAPDYPLRIGGVDIPHEKGLVGHSDGDALLHAITDALLGASGLGTIGERFPDTDARYRGIASDVLLHETAILVRENGFQIGNVDSNVLAERPRLQPYLQLMQAKIAEVLDLPTEAVAVKAKTMEGLGSIGGEEAIAAQAIVIVFVERQ